MKARSKAPRAELMDLQEIDNIVALREEYAEVDSRIRGSHSNLPHGLLHDSDNDMARFQHSPVRPVQTGKTCPRTSVSIY